MGESHERRDNPAAEAHVAGEHATAPDRTGALRRLRRQDQPGRSAQAALAGLPVASDPRVLVGHDTSDDAAVIRLRDDLALVETVDIFPPIVDDPFDYGRIAAANALSDIYAMGATPLNALSFVAWPVDRLGTAPLRQVLDGAAAICAEAGIAISGGHSIVDEEPKFGLFVTGTIHPDRIVSNAGARPGDALVLTKPIGTGVLTTAVKRNAAPESVLQAAIRSMTTLNRHAAEAMVTARATPAPTSRASAFWAISATCCAPRRPPPASRSARACPMPPCRSSTRSRPSWRRASAPAAPSAISNTPRPTRALPNSLSRAAAPAAGRRPEPRAAS